VKTAGGVSGRSFKAKTPAEKRGGKGIAVSAAVAGRWPAIGVSRSQPERRRKSRASAKKIFCKTAQRIRSLAGINDESAAAALAAASQLNAAAASAQRCGSGGG